MQFNDSKILAKIIQLLVGDNKIILEPTKWTDDPSVDDDKSKLLLFFE